MFLAFTVHLVGSGQFYDIQETTRSILRLFSLHVARLLVTDPNAFHVTTEGGRRHDPATHPREETEQLQN